MNNFPDGSEENTFSQRRLPSSDSTDQIIWTERKDVYRPILQSIDDFTRRRGIPRSGYNEVFFSIEALETLTRHLDTNLQIEQGGILFGNAYQDSTHGIYVEITAAVPAPQTIGTVAHLEFTPDSWLSIMNYARAQHPTENLVGWYHSHPNHGVFMSGVDMRTQAAFFSHPWCLSVVCDPIRKEIAYFLGKTASRVHPVKFSLSGRTLSQRPELPASPHNSDFPEIRSSGTSAPNVDLTEENDDSKPTSENNVASIAILVLKGFLKWLANLSTVIVLCLTVWNAVLLGLNQYFLQLLASRTYFHFNSLMRSYNFWTILLNIFAFILLIFAALKTKEKNLRANRSPQVRGHRRN